MKKNFAMKKLYYSISEVSRIAELEQYVLRYWETEFEQLRPAKNLSGNRIYTNKDIKIILYIKKLLREEKYTIEGAKKLIKNYFLRDENVESKREENNGQKISDIPTSRNSEMSLFGPEPAEKDFTLTKNDDLKEDLLELKAFLENLLNDL